VSDYTKDLVMIIDCYAVVNLDSAEVWPILFMSLWWASDLVDSPISRCGYGACCWVLCSMYQSSVYVFQWLYWLHIECSESGCSSETVHTAGVPGWTISHWRLDFYLSWSTFYSTCSRALKIAVIILVT